MLIPRSNFLVMCRLRESTGSWHLLGDHMLRDAAMSAADIYASQHMDQETGVFELTTIMYTELVTRVVKV